MANVIGWVIAFGLLWITSALANPIVGFFEGRVKPPEARTPETAPYPVELPLMADVENAELVSYGDGYWMYTWEVTSKSQSPEVASFFKRTYPKLDIYGEEGFYEAEMTPEGAKPDEVVTIFIQPPIPGETTTTLVTISELKHSPGFVPSRSTVRWILWILVLGALTVGQKPLVRWFGKLNVAMGGTKFEKLPAGVTKPEILNAWEVPTSMLVREGWTHLFDYKASTLGIACFARLFTRENKTFVNLEYFGSGKDAHSAVEAMSFFTDGTTLTTSNSKHAKALERPASHPIVKAREGTNAMEVIRTHQNSIGSQEAQGKTVAVVAEDQIFELLRRLEQEVHVPDQPSAPAAVAATPPPSVVPEAPVEQAPPEPQVDPAQEKAEFKARVLGLLKEAGPNLNIREKDGMALAIVKGSYSHDVDLETLFYMWKNNPKDQDVILVNFIRQQVR